MEEGSGSLFLCPILWKPAVSLLGACPPLRTGAYECSEGFGFVHLPNL